MDQKLFESVVREIDVGDGTKVSAVPISSIAEVLGVSQSRLYERLKDAHALTMNISGEKGSYVHRDVALGLLRDQKTTSLQHGVPTGVPSLSSVMVEALKAIIDRGGSPEDIQRAADRLERITKGGGNQ